ncbi:UDP-galactose transporter [Dispira parvispora]|uniref:UDP-galactose transporter homolog 1 n=1 Tax=Dispira parvispora TaxID=1520584 RepID=A0A9W8E6B5_9FUNG|nr:UDP-galactose transporter [Dispira parvispora]
MLDLLLCVSGIYTCFLSWALLQERVSTTAYDGQRFRFFVVLNLVQALMSAVAATCYLWATGQRLRRPSRGLLKRYVQAALTNALASPFGYASLKHIDYPTMTLAKTCKLVPVVVMNMVLYRRRFPFYKYVTVLLVTLGVSGFMLLQPVDAKASKKGAAANSIWGLLLVLINLLMDGATNSTQDQTFHEFKHVTGQHMMLFMNLLGACIMLGWLTLNPWNPELSQALAFISQYPQVATDILLFTLCGAVGQCFIFYTLARFGSLVLVTVNVTRKLFTMLLSVFWYNHQLSLGQWASVAVVFSGIGLEAFVKRRETLAKEKAGQKNVKDEKIDSSTASSVPTAIADKKRA